MSAGEDPSRAEPTPPRSDEQDEKILDEDSFEVDPDELPAWDADDPRRKHDQFAPPTEPCECYCLHCQRTFMSDQIWFQKVIGDPSGFEGFWMCPTPNCGGAGFTFDIFPTDPNHPANAGWHSFDTDDEDEEFADDDEDEWSEGGFSDPDFEDTLTAEAEYDPEEPQYKSLDQGYGDGSDDFVEGDEWKHGLEPGQHPPPQMHWSDESRREWEEQQKKYDGPDERPRELDWSNRDDREGIRDEDIPF
jgi:hypothetical protein